MKNSKNTVVFGNDNSVKGYNCFVAGSDNSVIGHNAVVVGNECEARHNRAIAIGTENVAESYGSAVIGGEEAIARSPGTALLGSRQGESDVEWAISTSNPYAPHCTPGRPASGSFLHRSDSDTVSLYRVSRDSADMATVNAMYVDAVGELHVDVIVVTVYNGELRVLSAISNFFEIRMEKVLCPMEDDPAGFSELTLRCRDRKEKGYISVTVMLNRMKLE